MTKLRYNKALLDIICNRDSCTVNLTEEVCNNLIRDTSIEFDCGVPECTNKGTKVFRQLHKTGGFCDTCTKRIANEKYIKTNMEIYGTAYPMQNAEVQKKTAQTNEERYGYKFIMQNPIMIEKREETYLENFGVRNPMQNIEFQNKIKQATLERTGFEHNFQNPEVQAKIRATNKITYGHENAMHNVDIANKAITNAHKSKSFTFPCGNVLQVQGYEPFALELLVKKGKSYNDITTDRREVPEIWYNTDDGKKHIYFCDILLHNEDKIIEVKSDWTLEKGKDVIPLKAQACIDAGFEYEIWIFDEKKNLKVQTYDKPVMSFTEMLLS